jgi:cytochrome c oxidase subunit 2
MDPTTTANAGNVSHVFIYIVTLSAIFLLGITAAMIYFSVRYSRKRNPNPKDIHGHVGLEVTWTVIPTLLFLSMFYFGWTSWERMRNVPRDAMQIEVTAQQWSWTFKYPNGKESSELRLPLNQVVRCNLHSKDVIHGFFIPAFAVKQDVVPGKLNYVWFQPREAGTYDLLCSSYCGQGHPLMIGNVVVEPLDKFEAWYNAAEAQSGPEHGAILYKTKACAGCHSIDGTKVVGPTFKGLYGHQVTVLTGGAERNVKADDEYIKHSILEPNADVVKGYPPNVMPSQKGQLTDQDIADLTAYIKTLE